METTLQYSSYSKTSLKMPELSLLSRNSEARSSGSSIVSNGSIRVATLPITSIDDGESRFPKLEECAHFHYEHVELGPLKFDLIDDEQKFGNTDNDNDSWFTIEVESQNTVWVLRRSYENARILDHQLHKCVYDRKFSLLPELLPIPSDCENANKYVKDLIKKYCKRLSHIAAGSLINCGPILSWLELDNRGHHLLVADGDCCAINTPAVAAAYSVRKYTAHASDEISFDIGDIISVIDMPSPEESVWWRGKHGFLVGFFPSNCVAVITDKVPRNFFIKPQMHPISEPTKPVLRKHGKLISFFRSFILSRPTRRTLKQSGILKERVFGCDLGEHLLNSGRDLPDVLTSCAEFIEKFGIVDGIYRLSGVTSNIQRLRSTFDEDRVPALWEDESIRQDIHSVASLLKLYFRELPNPLCTYQLYDSFVNAVQSIPEKTTDVRLQLMRETVQKLPPPHFRTLEYLMKHLSRVAALGEKTGMTARNVAIVWAPNLLRSKQLENGSGVAALHGVGIQAVVTEFLIRYTDYIFCPIPNVGAKLPPTKGTPKKRPKSLAISTQTKLLSLEEAQNRVLTSARRADPNYIEVGGGPSCLPEKYHTVLELPESRCNVNKRRSPLKWKSFFTPISLGTSPRWKKSEPNLKPSINMDSTEYQHQSIVNGINVQDIPKSANLVSETLSLKEIKGTPPCSPPHSNSIGHNRSMSHDSYFDQLADQDNLRTSPILHPSQEDLSDLRIDFDLDESDMRVFSDEDTNHIFSNQSSMEQIQNLTSNNLSNSTKRLPVLTHAEDSLSIDPSPKKKKTNSNKDDDNTINNRLSYLEERFASPDIRFIDSQSPEHMTVAAEIHTECDQIMMDVNSNNESGTDSLSTITTPTLSYCPLSEESYSDQNATPSSRITEIDFIRSPDLLTINLLTTPRNRLSYQGDLRNKKLSNDRLSFQEIKFKNVQDTRHFEFFNKNNDKDKLNVSIVTESSSCSPREEESTFGIVMGNNYKRLSNKSSILHQEDSSYEEVMPTCKSSFDSIDNLNFESEKSVDNIHYETLIVSSPESNNSIQHETLDSPKGCFEHASYKNEKASETPKDQKLLDNNDCLVSLINEDTEMLLQDRIKSKTCPSKNNEHINQSAKLNDENISLVSTKKGTESNMDLFFNSNRRKFESEIGRDIVHERRMRKDLTKNSSSTGDKENSTNCQESINKFDIDKSPEKCSDWIKNRRLRNNCQVVSTTSSLDTYDFPIDNQNLECVKISSNLQNSNISCQKSEISSDTDITRRERINRYKEERRLALRERFKISESERNDDEIVKRLRAKSLKSPDECIDSTNMLTKQPKRLVKIRTYDDRDTVSADSEQKEWYTHSLERKQCANKEMKGLVASRVNQLISCTTSSDGINRINTTTADKSISSSVRQRAHSTSDKPSQFCIKDITAFFEQKQ